MTRLPQSKKRSPFRLTACVNLIWRRIVPSKKSSQSRLQRRLSLSLGRNRRFFDLVRRRRSRYENRPSQLSKRLRVRRILQRKLRLALVALASLGVGAACWGGLFINEQVTLGGVPYRVVRKFWNSQAARDAYFAGDRQALHDQLSALGVENDIKNYYRDRFDNEYELDRHIHQIMFDRTGYVGEAYDVDNYGRLNSRSY